jgi:hypothetical protein
MSPTRGLTPYSGYSNLEAGNIMEPQSTIHSNEFYVRSCAKAFLEGRQNLVWVTKVLEYSGATRDQTGEILRPLANYGDPRRVQQLFEWLATAEW